MKYLADGHKIAFLSLVGYFMIVPQQVGCTRHVLLFPLYTETRQVLFESVETQLRIGGYQVTFLVYGEDLGERPPPPNSILIPDGKWSGAQRQLENWELHALQNWDKRVAHVPATYLEALAQRCEAVLGNEQLLSQLKALQLTLILGDLWGNDLCALALSRKLNVLVGGIVPTSLIEPISRYVNAPYPPNYVPASSSENVGSISTLGDRATNLYLYLQNLYHWDSSYYRPATAMICRHFPTCISPADLYQDLAVVFVNEAVSLDFPPRPMPPNIVFIGGLHCHIAAQLPKDMDDIARMHRPGIILLTLSSSREQYPEPLIKILLDGLSQLPQATFWKTNLTKPDNLPKHIYMSPAFPAQNIMGHGRTRLVISSCDRDTVFAAIFHQVPLLCIPILEGQVELARKVEVKGIGLTLTLQHLTMASLVTTIHTLVSNNSFHLNARLHSELLRDEPEPPNDRLLFWIEYIIRHNGAVHLQSPAIRLGFWEYFFIDLFTIAAVVVVATTFAIVCAFRTLGKLKTKKTLKKKSE